VSLISDDGVSQRLTNSALANIANTLSGAAPRRRRTSALGLVCNHLLRAPCQKSIRLINGSFPERLMSRNPSARLFKGFPAQSELMDPSFNPAFHYSRVFQDFQVLGNCRLRGVKPPTKFTASLAIA
jgi:hypothetical protein